jgi:hypothetical protein
VPIKLPGNPPFAGASFPSHPAHVPSSASLSQSTHSLVWISDLISMASTCSQPIAHSYPYASNVESSFQFPKPPPSDASIFGCTARFNLSAMDVPASMNGRRFQAPPAVGQPLPPACAAELSEDGEIFDSDADDDDADLPSLRQILASPKRVIEVIDLTCDDDGDSEGDDGSHTEVSCLRYTRTARHRVTLTSTPLTDRFRVADQLPFPPTVLSAKLTGTHRQRPHNVIYSSHTWQEETPLGQCPSVVPIVPQTSTGFR